MSVQVDRPPVGLEDKQIENVSMSKYTHFIQNVRNV